MIIELIFLLFEFNDKRSILKGGPFGTYTTNYSRINALNLINAYNVLPEYKAFQTQEYMAEKPEVVTAQRLI